MDEGAEWWTGGLENKCADGYAHGLIDILAYQWTQRLRVIRLKLLSLLCLSRCKKVKPKRRE